MVFLIILGALVRKTLELEGKTRVLDTLKSLKSGNVGSRWKFLRRFLRKSVNYIVNYEVSG